jgi:hypothetical protein
MPLSPSHPGSLSFLGLIQGIQIAAVQASDDRVAEVGKMSPRLNESFTPELPKTIPLLTS